MVAKGCSLQRFQDATGLTLTDRDGTLKEELPPISQFLNRLLALTIELQNTLFAAFEALLEAKIEGAIASGTYDVGVETITAASLRIVERRTIYTHPGTGAATQAFTIARRDRNEPLSLGDAREQGAKRGCRLLLNGKSRRAAVQVPAPSLMLDDGSVERRVRLLRSLERPSIAVDALAATAWRPTDPESFAVAWEAELAQLPEFRESTLHVVTGLLLPIWRQLPNDGGRVYRLQTDDGERVIGRQVSPAWVAAACATVPEISPEDAFAGLMNGRMVLHLADGVQLRRVRIMHAHPEKQVYNQHALQTPVSAYQLMAGTVIAASLITGLNSDLPGFVIAQVTEHVYDTVSGRFLLIPQGSRFIGKYDNIVAFGQERALVVWQRIILPDGSSLADEVDLHTWKLLKGVALATVMGVGSELAFGSAESDLVKALQQSTQSTTNRAGQRLIERNLSVQPTITVRPGWPLRVIVHKDLVFRRPYRGTVSH